MQEWDIKVLNIRAFAVDFCCILRCLKPLK